MSQGKFLAFYQFAKTFNSDNFDYSQLDNLDFVFMRWKVSLFACFLVSYTCILQAEFPSI